MRLARAKAGAYARDMRVLKTPQYRTDANGMQVPDVRAEAAIIYNPVTHEVLWEENSQSSRSIASITKVMTAVVFLEHASNLGYEIEVQPADVRAASTTYLKAYERATPDTLLHLLLIGSDNAAARVARAQLTIRLAGLHRSDEREGQGARARKRRTTPILPGLDAANVSSAYDMARLIAFAGNDERIASIMRKSEQSLTTSRRTITVRNTNKLTRDGSDVQVKGGKTGFIRQAGYCLATLLQLPQGDPVAVVVLGARSNAGRFMETKHLFNWLSERTKSLLTTDPAKRRSPRSPRFRSLSSRFEPQAAGGSAKMPVVPPTAGSSTFPPARSEPREVVELRRLRERQPQLASAIDLQLELLEMHRRMAARVSIPRNYRDIPMLGERLTRGETLLRYEDIALDWGELRRLLRDVSDLLRRFGMMEADDVQRVHALTRESQALEPLVRWWYESMASPEQRGRGADRGGGEFRARAAAGDAAVPVAFGGSAARARGLFGVDARGLSDVWRPSGVRRVAGGWRASSRVQPLHGAVAIRGRGVSVLRIVRSRASAFVRESVANVSRGCVRSVSALSQRVRWPRGESSVDARIRRDCDAAIGCCRHTAGLCRLIPAATLAVGS